MLNGRLTLHDIEDVEAFCVYLINRQRRGGYSGYDYEDLLAWFIESTWKLSLRYDSGRGSSFRNFVASKLRVSSWERERFGRTVWQFSTHVYVRPRPQFVPYDDQPDVADPGGAGNAPADSIQDVLGIHRERGGENDEDEHRFGPREHGAAA